MLVFLPQRKPVKKFIIITKRKNDAGIEQFYFLKMNLFGQSLQTYLYQISSDKLNLNIGKTILAKRDGLLKRLYVHTVE